MPPEIETLKALKGDLIYIAPELLLTAVGFLALIYDFTFLRKRPAAERQSRLGGLTLAGVLAALVLQVVMMLPASLNGFDTTKIYVPLFSGTIASDGTTAWMNLTVLGLLALVVLQSTTWPFTEHWGEYFALLCWAGVGMMFLIAAEELITLFLTLETMTLCLYMITSFEKTRRRSAEGGLKYFVYGSVSSALFLFGLSLIYGLTGSTRLDVIRTVLFDSGSAAGLGGNVTGATAVLLVLVGFGFKVAAVPFHQWAPDAYEGAPAPVTAWIATGSKIASFVALLKVLVGALAPWAMKGGNITSPGWIGIVAAISAITMTFGNFAALAQTNFKRMLAYSSIAHAGYLLVGVLAAIVSVGRSTSIAPVLFYLVIYAFTTAGAFAVAAWMVRDKGTDRIDDLNGLGYRSPFLAVCILILMLSLIGMPPLAGFNGKIYMFMEALNTTGQGRLPLTWLVMLGLFNTVVSAFYYVRVLKAMFLRPSEGTPLGSARPAIGGSILAGTAFAVVFGLAPAPLLNAMRGAAISRPGPLIASDTPVNPRVAMTDEERAEYDRKKDEEVRAKNSRVVRVAPGGMMAGPAPSVGDGRPQAKSKAGGGRR